MSIGAPGAVDPERGVVHHAPNLGWKDVPLARELKALVKIPVVVENDVHVGLIGEHALGAGKGTSELLGIFIGTGIGGGIYENGRVWRGADKFERRSEHSFCAWLFRIARNQALDYLRRQAARPKTVDIEENLANNRRSPDAPARP